MYACVLLGLLRNPHLNATLHTELAVSTNTCTSTMRHPPQMISRSDIGMAGGMAVSKRSGQPRKCGELQRSVLVPVV